MNYSKTQSLASFVNESAVLKNRLSEWFNELFKNTVTCFICKWISCFEESFEWMIQWFLKKQSLASFVNESAVLKNRLSEWFNELFKNTVTCFICKWISCFEESFESMIQWIIQNTVTCFICKWISCFEESFEWMIQWFLQKQSLASFVNESAVLKESFEWMIQWFIQIQSLASFVNESAVLNKSFEWMIQWFLQKHSHSLHL